MKRKLIIFWAVITALISLLACVACGETPDNSGKNPSGPSTEAKYTGVFYFSNSDGYVALVLHEDGSFYMHDIGFATAVGDYEYNSDKTKLTLSCMNIPKVSGEYDVVVSDNIVTIKQMYLAVNYNDVKDDLKYNDSVTVNEEGVELYGYYDFLNENRRISFKSDKTYTCEVDGVSFGTYTMQIAAGGEITFTMTPDAELEDTNTYQVVVNESSIVFKKGSSQFTLTDTSINDMVAHIKLEGAKQDETAVTLGLYEDGRCLLSIGEGIAQISYIGSYSFDESKNEYAITVGDSQAAVFAENDDELLAGTITLGSEQVALTEVAEQKEAVITLVGGNASVYLYDDNTAKISANWWGAYPAEYQGTWAEESGTITVTYKTQDPTTQTMVDATLTLTKNKSGLYAGTLSGYGDRANLLERVVAKTLVDSTKASVLLYNDGTAKISANWWGAYAAEYQGTWAEESGTITVTYQTYDTTTQTMVDATLTLTKNANELYAGTLSGYGDTANLLERVVVKKLVDGTKASVLLYNDNTAKISANWWGAYAAEYQGTWAEESGTITVTYQTYDTTTQTMVDATLTLTKNASDKYTGTLAGYGDTATLVEE